MIDALLREPPQGRGDSSQDTELSATDAGRTLLARSREVQALAVCRLVDRLEGFDQEMDRIRAKTELPGNPDSEPDWEEVAGRSRRAILALRELLKLNLPLPDDALLSILGRINDSTERRHWGPVTEIATAVANRAAARVLTDELCRAIESALELLRKYPREDELSRAAARLAKLIEQSLFGRLDPGEVWSDAALDDLSAMDSKRWRAWLALLNSCQSAGKARFSPVWRAKVERLVEAVGRADFRAKILRWFPLVDRPRTQAMPRAVHGEPEYDDQIEPHHAAILRGLVWCVGVEPDRELARALSALALSAYRKVPGKGPRLIALGHAAVGVLGAMQGMDAVGQLALLKVKVKFIPAQKEIEMALTAAAAREGLPREEIDELAVPAYGMEEVGRRREVFGDYAAELVIDGSEPILKWSKVADGKPIKSVPAAVKKDHPEDVKELQGALKDVDKMLAAQRERIDGLFLSRNRWPFAAWRERYLDHPLVGVIARRLIWRFETVGQVADGIWLDGRIVGADDRAVEGLGESTTVELWHPIGRSVEEITAWRDWLDRHQVRQPFKQAYREVYVLTDAERNTRVYSNRFAAHVIRQHQYHALCAARGWRNRLRMLYFDSCPQTSKDLPAWGLRVEFWVEGVGDYNDPDVNEAGSYRHLSTDQVRFYELGGDHDRDRFDAEPTPMERVPALVLSEILRDVDLFVGVASVGNDPTWADGGPDGRHVDYWNRYSFGDLSANGQTRKAVLERLIPRLKIAPRCSFSEKFLVVRGDLRTYKIHLGSGNILMEPNDQYLCIVAKRGGDAAGSGGVFLPFEGDNTLSIIISKAFLLAEDSKIADPTIVSQIKR